jgi:hypothetical protein
VSIGERYVVISAAVPPVDRLVAKRKLLADRETSEAIRLVNAARQGRIYRSKKRPGSGRSGRAQVRVGVFAQLDYFLFGDDPLGMRYIPENRSRPTVSAPPVLGTM